MPALADEDKATYKDLDEDSITIKSDIQSADNSTGVFTAIGNVRIDYPLREIIAKAQQAQYFRNEKKLVLSGDVDFDRNGLNSIRGERVIYLLDQDEVFAENSQLSLFLENPDQRTISK